MSTTLHEAIAAVRAGNMEQAQLLAADIVRENPNDPNGWYLLSQLVDSDARRAAYLGKTLALDPQHSRARMEFDSLPPALVADLLPGGATVAAEAIAEAEPFAQPPSDDAAEWVSEAEVVAEAEPVAVAGASVEPSADVPDWLQPLAAKPVPPSTHLTPARPAPDQAQPAARKPAAVKKKQKNSGNQALSLLLGLLLLLTVLVVAFLIYLLLF